MSANVVNLFGLKDGDESTKHNEEILQNFMVAYSSFGLEFGQ
jgi:hypothetical protein